MNPIRNLPVEPVNASSLVEGVSYDQVRRVLYVFLRKGRRAAYRDVPPARVEALKGARSPGSYYNQVIKRHHAYYPV